MYISLVIYKLMSLLYKIIFFLPNFEIIYMNLTINKKNNLKLIKI